MFYQCINALVGSSLPTSNIFLRCKIKAVEQICFIKKKACNEPGIVLFFGFLVSHINS